MKLTKTIKELGKYILHRSSMDIVQAFPLYAPNSAGAYKSRAALTVQAINQVFPFLSSFSTSLNGCVLSLEEIDELFNRSESRTSISALKTLFDQYGSDKAASHNYHIIYGSIFANPTAVKAVLEIGLGTNNTDIVSNMGNAGRPGAPLPPFRDFLPNAAIYGADIDRRILFSEERIRTFHIDQTDSDTFRALGEEVPHDFDLIIDDGLHSPHANIQTLNFALRRLRVGGWVVIEDIPLAAFPFWQVVAALITDRLEAKMVRTKSALVFAVRRLM